MLLCALGGLLLLLFSCLDVWYFLRGVVVVVQAWFQPPVWDVLAEQSVPGRVLPHDLDYMGHMNNARYLRECDFARFHHYMRNGICKALRTLGATMVVGASTIRYRRSLAFGEAFDLRTRIVAWDDKSFFVEQRFVSQGDGFISAVMLCRQNVLRSNPESILQLLCKRKVECPDYPEDLQHWISFISASSQALRAQSGLVDKTGAQEDKDKQQSRPENQATVQTRTPGNSPGNSPDQNTRQQSRLEHQATVQTRTPGNSPG